MENWKEFKDDIVKSLRFEEVTEDMKRSLNRWFVDVAIPLAKAAADNFVKQTKAQSEKETGWCRVRDLIVLPMAIECGLWLADNALRKTMEANH